MNGYVYALAVSGTALYAGGEFTMAGGNAANNVAKWDGTNWSALGSGLSGSVRALVIFGSNLYAGGSFTFANPVAVNSVARWDGTNWTALGSGINNGGTIYALAVSGNDLYAGGTLLAAGGKVSGFIARAYLLPLPILSILGSGSDITLSWNSADPGFTLEQSPSLASPPLWTPNTATITDDGTTKSLTLPATNSIQFFRLRKP